RDDGRGGAHHGGTRHPGGLRRADPRPGSRGGRDRCRLHLGRRADPLGQGLRPRARLPDAVAMPLLAADIGNSHTVLGLVDRGEVSADWRISTDDRRSADEWAVLLRGLLGTAIEEVDGIAVCATVPAVLQEWRTMLAR